MDTLKRLFAKASNDYNSSTPHYEACLNLVLYCHGKLTRQADFRYYGDFKGRPPVPYNVFAIAGSLSRPVRSDLYIADGKAFTDEHAHVFNILRDRTHAWVAGDYAMATRVVYTAVMSLA